MSYTVCDSCGRYYKLKEGESPEDLKCECGGSLNYVQDFEMHVMDELDPLDRFVICPNCGKANFKELEECEFCGKTLNNTKETQNEQEYTKIKLIIACIIIFFIAILIYILLTKA